MKSRLLFISMILFVMAACSYQVPLKHELAMQSTPAVRNERILVVMSREQAEKIINYSPQMGDTYVFEGGPALKDLIMNILGQVYSSVSYAETLDRAVTEYDRAVEVVLRNHEIVMNVYTGNTVKLDIDYTIFNPQGEPVDHFATQSSSKERYDGSDYVKTYVIGAFYNIGKMKEQIGAAWDTAAINSIGALIDRLSGEG